MLLSAVYKFEFCVVYLPFVHLCFNETAGASQSVLSSGVLFLTKFLLLLTRAHRVSMTFSVSLRFNRPVNGLPFFRWTWVNKYQNVCILDLIGAKDAEGGGDNWSYKTCKAPVKSSPPTN